MSDSDELLKCVLRYFQLHIEIRYRERRHVIYEYEIFAWIRRNLDEYLFLSNSHLRDSLIPIFQLLLNFEVLTIEPSHWQPTVVMFVLSNKIYKQFINEYFSGNIDGI